MKNARMAAVFLALAVLCAQPSAWADANEALFKNICTKLAYLDKQTQSKKIDDPLWRSKSVEFRNALKKLVAADPLSIWSDDAQFIAAMLSTVDKTDVAEKETFLIMFPKGSAEPWTVQQLDYLVPAKLPLDLSVRMELVKDYLRRGDKAKLSRLCQESEIKYPDKALWFKTMKGKLQ